VTVVRNEKANRRIPLIIGAIVFLQAFDGNVVLVALPSMAADLHQPTLSMNLVIVAYLIGGTIFLPLSGWLADRFGPRRVLNYALAGFAVMSLLCGLAPSATTLFCGRALQGAAGAALMPVGRILVLRSVDRNQFVAALSTLTMPVMMGPVLGPPVGGLIVELLNWRAVFLINLPLAVIGLVMVNRFIPESGAQTSSPPDLVGLLFSALALGAMTYGMTSMGDVHSGTLSAICLMVSAISAVLFVAHTRRHPDPVLDLSLMRFPLTRIVNLGGIFQRLLVSAHPFLIVLLFQVAFNLNTMVSSLLLSASAAGAIFSRSTFIKVVRVFGFRRFLLGSGLIHSAMIASCALLTARTPLPVAFVLLFAIGWLRSYHLVGLASLGYAGLPEEAVGTASMFSSIFQQMSNALGVAAAVIAIRLGEMAIGVPGVSRGAIAVAFLVIAGVSLISIIHYLRVPQDAGKDLIPGRMVAPSEA
jgi:MFS family permease